MRVAIIGGGAAGFFAAIHVKKNYPHSEVIIFEKSKKLLSKVKISGGGRCNVTNGCSSISQLSKAYPRGEKQLKKAFHIFNNHHIMEWFEKRNVPLVIQEDNCVFPQSQNSQSIIDCFLSESKKLGITIKIDHGIKNIQKINNQLQLIFNKENNTPPIFDKVIIAIGGVPKRKNLEWLEELGHQIKNPVPSLFTFNMPQESVTELMGIVVENVVAHIQGTKLKADGPLLITHWGMSGPAILKLSAFGARILEEKNYTFKIQVNWVHIQNHEIILNDLKNIIQEHPKKLLSNYRPYLLPERLWFYLLKKCNVSQNKKWEELGKKGLHQLINILSHDIYSVQGKTTFKEEFVTCGGISLESINSKTMQSKVCENLYFTGEVLDIDGITGGYNFQAAWTTAFIAAQLK